MSTTARTVLKDTISYVGGWALIIHQALFVAPKDVNEWFLLLGGSLIGVPGVAAIMALRAGTAGAPSSPAPPESAGPSEPSPSASSGGSAA